MITLVDTKATAGSGTSIMATTPSSEPGDLLLALLSSESGTPTYLIQNGWIPIDLGYTPEYSHAGLTALYKIASSPEPPTYTFTQNISKRQVAIISSFRGVDPINPIDASLFTKSGTNGAFFFYAPSVTTTTTDSFVIRAWASANSSLGTVTPPANTTFINFVQSNASIYAASSIQPAPGSTGTSRADWTGSPKAGAATIALRPSVPSVNYTKALSDIASASDLLTVRMGRYLQATDIVLASDDATHRHIKENTEAFDSRYDDLFENVDTPADTKPFISGDQISLVGYRDGQPLELPEGFYKWRVRALDPNGSGEWGEWTGYRRFEVLHGKAAAADDISSTVDAIFKTLRKTEADAQPTADLAIRAVKAPKSDTQPTADTISLKPTISIADAVEVLDLLDFGKSAEGDDEVFTSDEIAMAVTKALAEELTASDELTKQVTMPHSDTAPATDAIAKDVKHQRADSVLAEDAVSKQPGIPVADGVSFSDEVTKAVYKLLEEILKPEDATVQDIALPFADAIAIAEGIKLAVGKYIDGDEVFTSDETTSKSGLGIGDGVTFLDDLVKAVAKTLDDTAEIIDAPTYAAALYRSTQDAVEATDDSAKAIDLYKLSEASTSDDIGRAVAKPVLDEIEALDTFAQSIARAIYDDATVADQLSIDFTMGIIADEVWVDEQITKYYHLYAPEEYVDANDSFDYVLRQYIGRILQAKAKQEAIARQAIPYGRTERENISQGDILKARRMR